MVLISKCRHLYQKWREERRLPSRITNSPLLMVFLYVRLSIRCCLSAISRPAGISCVVALPIAKHRYCTYLMFVLQQTYGRILVVSDLTIRDLQVLLPEGRRIFSMKGVFFIKTRDFSRFNQLKESFDFVRASGGPPPPPGADRIFDIETDLAQLPVESSYLFPYGPHPNNFPKLSKQERVTEKIEHRTMRVFFSGMIDYSAHHDHGVMERIYDLPNRKATILELKRSFPTAVWVDNTAKRTRFDRGEYGDQIPLCIATVKGDPRKWLTDLRRTDFFLCLPGSHMPMCHNAVEAISMGCIPILCYENWFMPNLVHGVNCLSYCDLDGVKRAIDTALAMSQKDISLLRSNVWNYYDRYLNCLAAAQYVFGRVHPYRRLTVYLNQEDRENYVAARNPDSVLYKGGSLQSILNGDEINIMVQKEA
jgi:hypothetical protein